MVLVMSACAPPTSPSASGTRSGPPQQTKQIVASVFSQPAGLDQEVTNPTPSNSSAPGLAEIYALLNGGLSYVDSVGVIQPWFAEAIPSAENGLWQVFPDGRMETTWRLQSGVKWHDGGPLTTDDMRFTLDVYRDRELGAVPVPGLPLVDGMDTPDGQTAVIHWRQPFIYADSYFGSGTSQATGNRIVPTWLMPRHILEQPLQENKSGFFGLPYWREAFVGAGPFKLQEWQSGSRAILVANDQYARGRPQLDQIEVQFFSDRNVLKAALLAGAIQLPLGRGLNSDDALQMHSASEGLRVELGGPLGGVLPIYPRLAEPDPPVMANAQFRRALLMAIDRQEIADVVNNGLGPVAHSWVQTDWPEGRAVEDRIVRYPYDPRAAAQLIEALGYTKGPDGIFHGADGTKLSVQITTHEQNSFHIPTSLSVQTYWQRLGLDVQLDVAPAVRAADRTFWATFPSVLLVSRGIIRTPDGYFNLKAIPSADNNYVGGNVIRYGSAEQDALIDRYVATISFADRMADLGEMVHSQTDEVVMLPLFFQGSAFVVSSARVKNVIAGRVWNAHLWELD